MIGSYKCDYGIQRPRRLPAPLPPPPPPMSLPPTPTPPPSSTISLSAFLFIMCGLALSFYLIYYFLYDTCLRHRRRRQRNEHTIWLSDTIGLDQSQIESIHVFKYIRDDKLIQGTDCSVCLSEFEDDESLRLLPKCSHAFHVPCIDAWLRSHKNCPLCRAPIFKNTNDQTERAITESSSIESESTSEETEAPVNNSETVDDHHVVEVENNEAIVKTCGFVDETSSR